MFELQDCKTADEIAWKDYVNRKVAEVANVRQRMIIEMFSGLIASTGLTHDMLQKHYETAVQRADGQLEKHFRIQSTFPNV
ncbi:MAG: hypothetical protein QM811_06910 [Pirellulales bacterium]